ncbi:molybdopterin molybdotransferase MoeA [Methyloversatilis thermotolerans]|uniref:molybdopterin molybdotransferase MoeA n=1 Tax=Methyloversatilis thermotolerans TaxID=1346290 RepID=UPI00035C33BF|nr:gephyrin-like molybdotransferase Glp [Methyloversatilis thermotolerans]
MTEAATSVADARARILACCPAISGDETVGLHDALGRVLAIDLLSPIDVPAHDNSAMDGYAFRHADLDTRGDTALDVIGSALAGRPWHGELGPGQAVRIMTGAVIPQGADTVVAQEEVCAEGTRIGVRPGVAKGMNVRLAGEDVARGRIALPAGRQLRPADIGLAASLGVSTLRVFRRLRVGLLSTGDELMSLGEAPREGGIYDSNRYTLGSMLARLGCDVVDLGIARDDRDALSAALGAAVGDVDALITSGGVSAGDADHVRHLLAELGAVEFWKIAMKPGRPMAFGRLSRDGRNTLLFGLPGNPVASMISFLFIVRDGLLRLMGVSPLPELPRFQAITDQTLRKPPGRTEYQRGIMSLRNGQWHVSVTGSQSSGILRSMCEADCIIELGNDLTRIDAGDPVQIIPFSGLL